MTSVVCKLSLAIFDKPSGAAVPESQPFFGVPLTHPFSTLACLRNCGGLRSGPASGPPVRILPEPSTWALLAMGAGALLLGRRRR
jgi:hypothetical protein